MRVAVVSEFYPRADDPVLGVWAHRQAVAARDAGADVRVLVLHRPIPPLSTAPRDIARETLRRATQPLRADLDGIEIGYVPFVSPPRPRSYGSWGRWAAPSLRVALRRLRRRFPFDLVHAHNAVPAGDAVLRSGAGARRSSSPSTAATSSTPRAASRPATPRSGARSARRGSCSPTARASSARAATSAPSTRASCGSAPTCPSPCRPASASSRS